MFKPSVARQALRAVNNAATRPAAIRRAARPSLTINTRCISSTPSRLQDDSKKGTADPNGGGAYARTDESVVIEYPKDEEMPRSPIVQGRGGMHFKRTLALFSLENKVSVVTGGARGLGLVMGQALVASGSDLAIVDLNSTFCRNRYNAVRELYLLTCRRGGGRRPSQEACRSVPGGEPRAGEVGFLFPFSLCVLLVQLT